MFYTSTFNEVEALVRKYGTRDPFELISAVPDMKLWVTDNFQEDGLKGFATIQNRTKYIVVITATGGIGTNLYLAKVAMDIVAKHVPADKDGVRIAELDERKYRELLWTHEPITDFWRIGRGYAKKLAQHGMTTMGDVARCSIVNIFDFLVS